MFSLIPRSADITSALFLWSELFDDHGKNDGNH